MDELSRDDEPLLSRAALLGALAFTAVVTIGAFLLLPAAAAVATGVLTLLMTLITLTDLRHFIIPDVLSLPAIPLGIIANVALFHGDDWSGGVSESMLGAVLAGGSFYLLRALWFRLRGAEGLGLGDVKLAAVAGAWLGPGLLASVCLVASLAGLVGAAVMAVLPGRRPIAMADHIPFGTFIAPTILAFWFLRVYEAVPFW